MYPVSEAFLSAIRENTRSYHWSGRIQTKTGMEFTFGAKDIVKGSGYVTAQCCGNTEIELGTVYASEMGITLLSPMDRYTLEDAEIILSYHLCIRDGTYEEVPMGIFEVSEANRIGRCLELKAYDYMLRFEQGFNGFETIGTAYDFLTLCCKACGVELMHSKEELESMPNGAELLSLYTENDIETYRDVLYYVAQVLGGFLVINRIGKLELRKYGNLPMIEISLSQRFKSSFSDFTTRYTAVSSTNLHTQTAEYYALDVDDGLTMNLAVNPLLQFGLEETRELLCRNILNDISLVNYVPFETDTIGNPALDLGDVVSFSGGREDGTWLGCVTFFNDKIGGKQQLKCVGKNPRLSLAKSKNDKNLVGLLNQIAAGKMGFFSFTNAKGYDLTEARCEVIHMEFAASEETNAHFIGQIMLDLTADRVDKKVTALGRIVVPFPTALSENGTIEDIETDISLPVEWQEDGKVTVYASYELDDNELALPRPAEAYGSGLHIMSLYYPIMGVTSEKMHTFKVYLRISGGEASIAKGGCIASISGQGMAAATKNWDGTLNFEESIALRIVKMPNGRKPFQERIEFKTPPAVGVNHQEAYTKPRVHFMGMKSFD